MNTHEKGKKGESTAIEYLLNKGYKILYQNYWSKLGEIDIIAENQDATIFVEVKSSYYDVSSLEYLVDKRKQQRIIMASRDFIQKKHKKNVRIRYDIVFISNKNSDIYHIENAFCEG